MRPSSAESCAIARPQKRATTSIVMSSAVGPRPPLVTIRSTPWSAMKRSWASMSSGRSPQIVMCASSTPSSARRSDSHGPLRSWTRPVRTSVPVTTMPARALKRLSRAGSLGDGQLLAALAAELEADRRDTAPGRISLAVQLQLDGGLAEVHPQLGRLERLRRRHDALEHDRRPRALVDADVGRGDRLDLQGD